MDEPDRPVDEVEVINVVLSLHARDILRQLLKTGLFGASLAEVAERLMDERLRELILQGWAEIPDPEAERDAVLDTSVDELELSVRLSNILDTAGIKTIGDVVDRKSSDFLKMPHFGKRTMRELVDALEKQGVVWG